MKCSTVFMPQTAQTIATSALHLLNSILSNPKHQFGTGNSRSLATNEFTHPVQVRVKAKDPKDRSQRPINSILGWIYSTWDMDMVCYEKRGPLVV